MHHVFGREKGEKKGGYEMGQKRTLLLKPVPEMKKTLQSR